MILEDPPTGLTVVVAAIALLALFRMCAALVRRSRAAYPDMAKKWDETYDRLRRPRKSE